MKTKFSGYYNLTDDEVSDLWKNCVFVLDTNVLLDLYRLSPEVQNVLWEILDKIKERIWIPYQVAEEYHRNILDVIIGQAKKCDDAITDLEKLKNKVSQCFTEGRNFPYIEKSLQKKIVDACEEVSESIKKEKETIDDLILNNPTKEKLSSLLVNKVGERFSENELNDIYKEGEKRYKRKIPPGYADTKPKEGDNIYGDLVIWKEIIKYAKNNEKDIILVTSDNKEDWFNKKYKGKTTGPRCELRMEFKQETSKMYYAYSLSSFFEKASKYLNINGQIESDVIDEVVCFSSEETESTSTIIDGNTDSIDNLNYKCSDIDNISESKL